MTEEGEQHVEHDQQKRPAGRGSRALGSRLEGGGAFDRNRGSDELSVVATLALLVVAQVAFVAANLLWVPFSIPLEGARI
ncbi:hypothetical protein [Natrinema salaciae]|uniref:Uncharacterized protein n=1 Tax=Natrinema salaciae TaxID=1186196 RepID=A0A1H9MLU1_9EURY|nr:hypothetical protein [Natrinema salaciae]SER24123.1 hypothetical protein SAMN04489841_3395 [Natrinema salaciae]